MIVKRKKIFPKIKKKLKWFLTDESWKITKKDALWLAFWTVLLIWASEVDAALTHSSNSLCWHTNQLGVTWYVSWWNISWINTNAVNINGVWHYSNTPNWGAYNWTIIWWAQLSQPHANVDIHCSHGSHASHGSHGSHGQW